MISQEYILYASVFGGVAVLTYLVSEVMLRGESRPLRHRLTSGGRGRAPGESAPGERRNSAASVVSRISQAAAVPIMPKDRERQSRLRQRLGYAGIYTPGAMQMLVGAKALLMGAGLVGGYFAGAMVGQALPGLWLGSLIGYLLPNLWLTARVQQQQRVLEQSLPDALDLMVICVEAGLTLDAAIQRVAQEISLARPQIARELEITQLETRVGLSRGDALRNLGQRTGCPSLQSLAAMLIQADRFGTSIGTALRVQADSLRVKRQHKAEERAARTAVKLSFPVVLCIFPAVVLVLAGPAFITLFKTSFFGGR